MMTCSYIIQNKLIYLIFDTPKKIVTETKYMNARGGLL